MKTNLFDDLERRGLVHQVTDPGIQSWLEERPAVGYIGFDPTAPSLHVGSLLQVLLLVRLQRHGHQPIALIGGGTGLIGDPSGKQAERPMLTREVLGENVRSLRSQLERFLDFSGPRGAILVDNSEWLARLNLLDFLRDIGKLFSVNAMIARDSVRTRLESRDQGISYTEFSYSLLQAYDFLELSDRYSCQLQLGGSDQWGNILGGIELIRRLRGGAAFGLTSPLVTRDDGKKFGKSELGNVWLDAARTSPYDFYQFWLNTQDSDTFRYLKGFTFLPLEELSSLAREVNEFPERRAAQRLLASEVTRFVHGQTALEQAERTSRVLFEGESFEVLSHEELLAGLANCPATNLAWASLGSTEAVLTTQLVNAGLARSRGQARTAIIAGSIYINNRKVYDYAYVLGTKDVLAGRFVVLRRGSRSHHVLRIV